MKRLLAMLLAATMLLTLCACKNKSKEADATGTPSSTARFDAPDNVEDLATTFIRALYLDDLPTQHNLLLHDARQEWEELQLKSHKTEGAFCTVVQQQADEKGIDVDIQSFDDYLREYHNNCLRQMTETYGEYTIDISITSSIKMSDEALAAFIENLKNGFFAPYIQQSQLDAITEGYTVEVDYRVDGELKDFHETHSVYAVKCDGQWQVGSYTA